MSEFSAKLRANGHRLDGEGHSRSFFVPNPVSIGALDPESVFARPEIRVIGVTTGSSLDPSAELGTQLTTKIGFDLTKPLGRESKGFERAPYPEVDLSKFIEQEK